MAQDDGVPLVSWPTHRTDLADLPSRSSTTYPQRLPSSPSQDQQSPTTHEQEDSFRMYGRSEQRKLLDTMTSSVPASPDYDTAGRDSQDESRDGEHVAFLPRARRTSSSGMEHDARSTSQLPSVFVITMAAGLLVLIIDVVASVPMAARMVIFEDIICRNYYAAWGGDVANQDCKAEAVQSELAYINGWKETFDTIPGLVVSLPYAALADRIGRGQVLVLALVGLLFSDTWVAIVCTRQMLTVLLGSLPQTLPLRTIWLSGIFQFIGGGGATVISMCYTLIGDVCSAEQRTIAFSQVHAAVLFSDLVSIPLGSALINVDPWVPVLGALGLMVLSTLATLSFSLKHNSLKTINRSIDHGYISTERSPPKPTTVRDRVNNRLNALASASAWITKDVLLMLLAFFCCQLSRQFSGVLIQYSSYKFNWGFGKASYLISFRAGLNLIVLFTLIPRLMTFFTKQKGLPQSLADKYTTIVSGVLLIIGSLFIFVSASAFTLVLGQTFIALGFAFTVTARSFMTAMVDPRYVSLLYTSVTAVTFGGLIVGGPLLAGAFQWGLQLGGSWVGMPFLITALLFAIATMAVSAAKSLS